MGAPADLHPSTSASWPAPRAVAAAVPAIGPGPHVEDPDPRDLKYGRGPRVELGRFTARRPYPRRATDPTVPPSLALRDLTRVSESLVNAVSAAAMTAVTVGAGLSATGLLAGVALGLLREAPALSSPRVLETILLSVSCAGLVAISAALFVGLLHFVLPRALQFTFLLLQAPWFVPSTLLCAPVIALWRCGLWWKEPWEAGAMQNGLAPRWSFRSRRYGGRIDGRSIDVRQDVLGGGLEFRCPVPRHLPAAYIGPQKIAGAVGVLRPLVHCPALTNAELLLRDGKLVIRRRWVRPNLGHLASLVQKMVEEAPTGGLAAELQTISLLAEWRPLKAPIEERWTSPWFDSPAIMRYLDVLKRQVRAGPPSLEALENILIDPSIRAPMKAWLVSVLVHRLNADDARRLAELAPLAHRSPVDALTDAPRWPAWVGVHRLALEGGPEALGPLQNLIGELTFRSPLLRAARRASMKIIQRSGGIHTLTGHLSVVDEDGGQLTLVEPGALSEATDPSTTP